MRRSSQRRAIGRLTVVACLVVATAWAATAFGASEPETPAVPTAICGPGSLPETSIQGRVPKADYASGRAALGYRCNTELASHVTGTGGFKTLRYTDSHGNTCAFYDSEFVVAGRNLIPNLFSGQGGPGVVVLDMNDPSHPRKTANLLSPAMLMPHETLLVNQERGLLAATLGTAVAAPGLLEIYDVRSDCQHPKLLSTTLSSLLGHESGFAPDGNTFYASDNTLGFTAIDVSNPRKPHPIYAEGIAPYHGMRLSDDGRIMYAALSGSPLSALIPGKGLRILDVSDIQNRAPHPKVRILSDLSWHGGSTAQVAEPFTQHGHRYVLEVDEFIDLFSLQALVDMRHSPVGAARIIDVDDPQHPKVVSDIRLQVHEASVHGGEQWDDPGASMPAQGYAAHYCSVPTRVDPKIAGCSMILSGLRLFDIGDVEHPKEIGYFNQPAVKNTTGLFGTGSYAMSQPAWDPANHSVWFTDMNSGFYDVRLTNEAAGLLP